ncbi:MAG: hypothetical protein WD049_07175 [Candidatus Paceibacterota bacterium]
MKKRITKTTAISDVGFPFGFSGRMPVPAGKKLPIGWSYLQSLPCVVAIVLCFGIASSSHAQATDQQQKIESLLRRFPAADANKDGKLTLDEAKTYKAAHPELRRNQQTDGEGSERETKLDGVRCLNFMRLASSRV